MEATSIFKKKTKQNKTKQNKTKQNKKTKNKNKKNKTKLLYANDSRQAFGSVKLLIYL